MTVDRPNVVVLLPDQWRYSASGFAGNDDVMTPHVDALAEDGVSFGAAFTPKPMCTPARASLITGTHPHTNRVIHNDLSLPVERPSIGTAFKQAGYDTAYVGKWHLDGDTDLYVPPGDRRHGFDRWYGFETTAHDYDRGHPVIDDETGVTEWIDDYQPTAQTDITIELLEAFAEESDPFFLFVSYGPPHPPKGGWSEANAPDEFSDPYDPESLTLRPNVPETDIQIRPHLSRVTTDRVREDLVEYYGYISSIDQEVGRVCESLKRLGLDEETLFVFTSDHGEMVGSQGRYNKGAPFEEANRVPLVFRHPENLKSQRMQRQPVSLIDVMPTVLSHCNLPIPNGVQGTDLTPAFKNENSLDRDPVYVQGWRVEDDIPDEPDWGPFGQPWRLLRTERYAIVVDRTLETCYLFDVIEDPYQTINLAGNPSISDVEDELRQRLFEACERRNDRRFIVRTEYIANRQQFHDR